MAWFREILTRIFDRELLIAAAVGCIVIIIFLSCYILYGYVRSKREERYTQSDAALDRYALRRVSVKFIQNDLYKVCQNFVKAWYSFDISALDERYSKTLRESAYIAMKNLYSEGVRRIAVNVVCNSNKVLRQDNAQINVPTGILVEGSYEINVKKPDGITTELFCAEFLFSNFNEAWILTEIREIGKKDKNIDLLCLK